VGLLRRFGERENAEKHVPVLDDGLG